MKTTPEGIHAADTVQADLALRRYLKLLDETPRVKNPAPKRLAKRLVPAPIRSTVLLAVTDLVRPLAGRRARRLARRHAPVLVHLGSGRTHLSGWINVDLVAKNADVAWNLRRPLPFANESVDAVFHEHVLEHFNLADGYALTKEVFRMLRPGGILRIAVPDAERYVKSYVGTGDEIRQLRPGRPTAMLALQEVFLRHGHRAAYDFETLSFLLAAAGFGSTRRCGFGDTALSQAPDSDHRRGESIYVEALKPAGAATQT